MTVAQATIPQHKTTKSTKRRSVTRSLTRYVVFSIAVMVLYTIAVLILSCFGVVVPDALTTGVFSVFGGEILACCVIKLFKLVKRDDE